MTKSRLPSVASTIVICILVAGCKPKASPIPEATLAPAVVEGTQATEDECLDFVKKIEQAVRTKNRAGLERLIPMEALAIRGLNDLSLTGEERQSIMQGMRAGLAKKAVSTQIIENVKEGGSYTLLRLHKVDGRPRAMFRLIGSDSGVTYHDILLMRTRDGITVAEDVHLSSTGEMLSKTLRWIVLPAVVELSRNSVANVRGDERTLIKNAPRFLALVTAIESGNKAEAVKIYNSLPPEFREMKTIQLLYLQAIDAEDAEYVRVLEMYRKAFPGDSAADMLSIEHFNQKKRFDEALGCIDRTEKAVGADPYLHVLRANTLNAARRYPESRAAAEKAIEQEPTLAAAYWSRIIVSLGEKNHQDTLAWLMKLIEKTSEEVADLTKVVEYAEFVKSPQHAEWLKWYAAKKK